MKSGRAFISRSKDEKHIGESRFFRKEIKMMKKCYEKPDVLFVLFEEQDVVRTSGDEKDVGVDGGNMPGWWN